MIYYYGYYYGSFTHTGIIKNFQLSDSKSKVYDSRISIYDNNYSIHSQKKYKLFIEGY